MFSRLRCPCSSAIFKEQPRSAQNFVSIFDKPHIGKSPQQQPTCIISPAYHLFTSSPQPSLKQLLKPNATSCPSPLCELRKLVQLALKPHNFQLKYS
jgi:hypothetical protein